MGKIVRCEVCGGKLFYEGKNEWGEDIWECPNCLDEAEDDMPEGCSACGGPYPDCISSCEMFDDQVLVGAVKIAAPIIFVKILAREKYMPFYERKWD